MTIKSIQITGLFEIFNYMIEYPKGENVLIITGPNGFGKTKVLNIIFSLFNKQFSFFKKLVFEEIKISLNGNFSIAISKKTLANKKDNVTFTFFEGDKTIGNFEDTTRSDKLLLRNIEKYLPFNRIGADSWSRSNREKIYTTNEIYEEYGDYLLSKGGVSLKKPTKAVNDILNSIDVHLIREQRLFKKVVSNDPKYRITRVDRDQTIMIETIQTYSDELCRLISGRIQESYKITQLLDSTYPTRLISEKKKVSKEAYDLRFAALKNKQDKLMKNGLYEKTQEVLEYSESDAKALLVYLNDLEQKLEVFDNLLEKLELFTNILNERRFTYKSININKEKGFYFKTSKGKDLNLDQLSSGEQHEVVLLYELIFKTRPGILVLIDEPEISLHITWQKEFLDDLLRIIEIQNFQVLIATHSPSIINDRWDLVYNLEKNEAE